MGEHAVTTMPVAFYGLRRGGPCTDVGAVRRQARRSRRVHQTRPPTWARRHRCQWGGFSNHLVAPALFTPRKLTLAALARVGGTAERMPFSFRTRIARSRKPRPLARRVCNDIADVRHDRRRRSGVFTKTPCARRAERSTWSAAGSELDDVFTNQSDFFACSNVFPLTDFETSSRVSAHCVPKRLTLAASACVSAFRVFRHFETRSGARSVTMSRLRGTKLSVL